MGEIADAFNTAFRAYAVDGVPGSGANPPEKAEARALGALIEAVIGPVSQNLTLVGPAQTLTLDHLNAWLELSHTSEITVTVPANADVAYPLPADIFGAQAAAGQATFEGAPGVTILTAETQDPTTACEGAVWQLHQVDVDVWRLFGNLTAV